MLLISGLLLAAWPAGAQPAPAPPDSTVHGTEFRMDCARCHTPEGWGVLRPDTDFDHAETGFELRGAHAGAGCRACHQDPVFHRIGVLCADCHTDTAHRGELGFDCGRCHDESSWRLSAAMLFEHEQTRFPLVGRHALVDCETCHSSTQHNEYVNLPAYCVHCHTEDYLASRSPDHAALGLSADCERCHSAFHLFWSQAEFQHPASFPLTGVHDVGECAACHTPSNPLPIGSDCFGCHADDYGNATPDHIGGGFPTDCSWCHDPDGFSDVPAYAHLQSGFSMEGLHGRLPCAACHAAGTYAGLARDCYSCHQYDYENAREPDHIAESLPTQCERCHTPAGWHGTTAPRWGGRR
jgi:hypothetical protein